MNKLILSLSVLIISAGISLNAFAAVEMFLKMSDINGESMDAAHQGEIELIQWNFGIKRQTKVNGKIRYGTKPSVGSITITKIVDSTSPTFLANCCNKKQFDEAKLTVRKDGANPPEYLIIKMKKLIVTSYSTSGNSGEDVPTENVTFNFTKLEFDYVRQDEDGQRQGGTIDMKWNIETNKEE